MKGLIPDPKIKIGNEEVPVINTHRIELGVARGPYVNSAEFALLLIATANNIDLQTYTWAILPEQTG